MSAWKFCARGASLTILVGSCVTRPPPHAASRGDVKLQRIEIKDTASGDPAGDRGRASLGFVLESSLRARRFLNGATTLFLELSNGATVINGDRLQLHVRTSQDAYLYLAFCSQKARDPRYPGLKVFPEQGAIRVRAYETTIVPHPAAEIVLDDKPGQEALYLILSRADLSTSDVRLAEVIASTRQGSQSTDCVARFGAAVASPRKEHKPSEAWSGKLGARELRRASPAAASGPPRRASAGPQEDPVVEIQRGGDIVWKNGMSMGLDPDPDGIVILRYGLVHVAAP